jgi:hypothetical protein
MTDGRVRVHRAYMQSAYVHEDTIFDENGILISRYMPALQMWRVVSTAGFYTDFLIYVEDVRADYPAQARSWDEGA